MISNENRKRLLTGIKPTNTPTLGNYLGVLKHLPEFQDEYDMFVFVADLHALTLPIEPEQLRQNTADLVALYLACGLDPAKCKIFRQSRIFGHNDLSWVLLCNTNLSELTKMPQYKNYMETHKNAGIPSGMLVYPSLMAADILLYDADVVPMGQDQKPHLDLCRAMAKNFNKKFPGSFKLPAALLPKVGSKVMSLTNPTQKMSKSESDSGTIFILDDIEVSKKKIMKALTDSDNKFYYDPNNKPGLSNLIAIYAGLAEISVEAVVENFKNVENYAVFKRALCETLEQKLVPIQQKVAELRTSKECEKVLENCEDQVAAVAAAKLNNIYNQIGLR